LYCPLKCGGNINFPLPIIRFNISVGSRRIKNAVKDLFRRGVRFFIDSAVQIFVVLFGLVLVIATYLDKTFPPQQVLVWQAVGLTILATGFMRLIDLWWGMDASKKILDELGAQRTETQALRAEMTRMNNLLERRLEATTTAETAHKNGHQAEVEMESTSLS